MAGGGEEEITNKVIGVGVRRGAVGGGVGGWPGGGKEEITNKVIGVGVRRGAVGGGVGVWAGGGRGNN